jgi:hypothetical protein
MQRSSTSYTASGASGGVRKILLLRVGIDMGCGGTLGPIFQDGTFEYVPIPESSQNVSPRSL